MRVFVIAFAVLSLGGPFPLAAKVVGRHVAAESVNEAKIKTLPAEEQAAWLAYVAASKAQMARDKAALAAERGDGPVPPLAPKGPGGGGGMPLDRDPAWYGSAEARHVADNIVSFQTPAGGWGKNQERTGPVRLKGQGWTAEDVAWAARDIAGDPNWAFVGTIDNNGTSQELQFLALVQQQLPGQDGDRYRASFLKGVRYLLTAQFPNGGWPQVYPLMGGYHDHVTFNDGAIPKVLEVLALVAGRQGEYAFVPAALADQAKAALSRGLDLLLRSQVVVDGKRTLWGQQHDPFTLAPTGGRDWEPGALSAEEGSRILLTLMAVTEPSPQMIAAIHDGVAWLRERAMADLEWPEEKPDAGKRLTPKPGAGPLWARLYDVRAGKPIFGDREKNIHDDVHELPVEVRNSYSWFRKSPAKALSAYDKWRARHSGR